MVATQLFWEFCTPKIGKDEPIVTVAYFSADELMKNPGWLGYIGIILPRYIGIIMNHYKEIPINPPGWLMESNNCFFVAQMSWWVQPPTKITFTNQLSRFLRERIAAFASEVTCCPPVPSKKIESEKDWRRSWEVPAFDMTVMTGPMGRDPWENGIFTMGFQPPNKNNGWIYITTIA